MDPPVEPPPKLVLRRDLLELENRTLEDLELEDELLRLFMRWRSWCCNNSSPADWALCTTDCKSAERLCRLSIPCLHQGALVVCTVTGARLRYVIRLNYSSKASVVERQLFSRDTNQVGIGKPGDNNRGRSTRNTWKSSLNRWQSAHRTQSHRAGAHRACANSVCAQYVCTASCEY